jgi:hypothetical protein
MAYDQAPKSSCHGERLHLVGRGEVEALSAALDAQEDEDDLLVPQTMPNDSVAYTRMAHGQSR